MTDEIKVGDEVEVQYSPDGEWWGDGHIIGAVVGEYYILSLGNREPRVVYKHTVRKPAPKPVVEEVVMCGGEEVGEKGYYTFSVGQDYPETHKITFNIVDGVPDCNSIKMEKL